MHHRTKKRNGRIHHCQRRHYSVFCGRRLLSVLLHVASFHHKYEMKGRNHMGNQRLAAGKAHFRMTSKGGAHSVPGIRPKYAELFMFGDRGEVVLRAGVTEATALPTIRQGRPYTPASNKHVNVFPDKVPDDYNGGSIKPVLVNVYERDRRACQRYLGKYGTDCAVCGMSFGERYGKEFAGLIRVHYLRQLSTIGRSYKNQSSDELAPGLSELPNSAPSSKKAYTIDEARSFLGGKKPR